MAAGAGRRRWALVGLAGAWPALAARAASPWRRAALGATGWIWLVLAGRSADAPCICRRIAGHDRRRNLVRLCRGVLHHALLPVLRSAGADAGAVWALAAVVLPWLVRGRSLPG